MLEEMLAFHLLHEHLDLVVLLLYELLEHVDLLAEALALNSNEALHILEDIVEEVFDDLDNLVFCVKELVPHDFVHVLLLPLEVLNTLNIACVVNTKPVYELLAVAVHLLYRVDLGRLLQLLVLLNMRQNALRTERHHALRLPAEVRDVLLPVVDARLRGQRAVLRRLLEVLLLLLLLHHRIIIIADVHELGLGGLWGGQLVVLLLL